MKPEGEQLQLRLHQWAERAARLDRPVTGRFLAAEERALALREARAAGVSASFDGGWDEAERVQVCFHPAMDEPVFTGVWLEIRWHAKFVRVEHSDLLGSLMALGMDRSFMGDIIVGEGAAHLCVMPEMAQRLPMEWTQAGRAAITVRQLDEMPVIAPPRGQMLRDTVPSLRLDCLVSSGMKLSRARAAEIIRQGLVSVDHQLEERVDRLLQPGQLISIRHFGRIRLTAVDPPTRKDRLPVTLEIFSK
ncbi:MAG: hypothetical protein IKK21_00290 [Clostridia bacterium]|nr:hypothetical protein [Clostridia bacterium]